jgi:uncharacterized surface protein with fasciclin (FAS1) repeats
MRKLVLVLATALVAVAAVIAPTAGAAPAQKKNIAQVAAGNKQFSTLVSLLKQAGLVTTLTKGSYTVFAPTNAAFAKVPKATLDQVANDPKLLRKVLLYHVVKGKVPAATVVTLDGKSAKTVQGQNVKIRIKNGKVFLNGSTQVTTADVGASNGVIHVVNRVLLPK